MNIAALYDIHGNLPALNAVLGEIEKSEVDLIVIGGDIVSGPMPQQVLERLFQLKHRILYLRGNGDREVVTAYDGHPLTEELSEKAVELTNWVAAQISKKERDFLANLPEQQILQIPKVGEVLFCHATPRSDEEIFTPITSHNRLIPMFEGINQQIIVCGHTHLQFERRVGSRKIINAGSVGMPFAHSSGAYWLHLHSEGYKFRRTEFDGEEAARLIKAAGSPQCEEFTKNNVLKVPAVNDAIGFLEELTKKR
ncbi:metallophosphoesterase family protein [Bacillus spongiae]|uniref:Metallophosphoesterase family protein n=1 Tax=Bacillus spongiae TaxID=2683610 RepID=A0ABU8HEX3_9BACI